MQDATTYPVQAQWTKNAHINQQQYQTLYLQSQQSPQQFWQQQAEQFVTWFKPWQQIVSGEFQQCNVRWFEGAQLNVCYNCIDRHLPEKAQQTAIFWEGDEPGTEKAITYKELHQQVSKLANVLKSRGIKKGDRVCIYMPMIPEATMAMLACARIGAIHSVVFGGFSPQALRDRILDADCCAIITTDEGLRGGKIIPLKANADSALQECPNLHSCFVVKHTQTSQLNWQQSRDIDLKAAMAEANPDCPCEVMEANDPLFILYTSGSTGKPKGILHSSGGYLVYAAMTHHYVFDYHENDIYWCGADVGWITGHSYIVYGPLANGATSVMFEGVPTYPTPSRYWQIIDKYHVTIFYTAPTAIRALMREGDQAVTTSKRSSLRLLGTVGEPINPAAWEWYYHRVGSERCSIVDTWWQTETGGIMITPLIGATPLKPGSASNPFLGITTAIVDDNNQPLSNGHAGKLVITQPWPGMMLSIWGDKQRFYDSYFKEVPGCYLTGDEAFQDQDGYHWIIGRMDDVINISGHRIGTAEVESALVAHPQVTEAAVVGIAHEVKGQAIYAFVTLSKEIKGSDELQTQLLQQVRDTIGAFAKPAVIQWTSALPKTRSGKIMRRILRNIATGKTDDLGDTSTLADASVLNELINNGGNDD